MHHMSLRHGFKSFSAKRRRTVSRETLWRVVRRASSPAKASKVQRERPAGGLEQAVATSKASSLPVSLRRAPGRGSSLSAAARLPSTKRRLVRVYGRAADADASGDLLIVGAAIRRQQNLRAFELARPTLAAAQQSGQLVAFALVEFDPIAYIHPCLLWLRHGPATESDGQIESPGKNLHAEAGPVSGVYPPLYALTLPTPGRNRHAAILPR